MLLFNKSKSFNQGAESTRSGRGGRGLGHGGHRGLHNNTYQQNQLTTTSNDNSDMTKGIKKRSFQSTMI